MPRGVPATRRVARLAFAAAASALESPSNGEQAAGCATAGVPALRIGSFDLFSHDTPCAAIPCALFHTIVRRFFRDDNVVNVALAQARSGNSNKSAFLAEFFERARSHVAHAALQSADELICQSPQLALVGHASFHAFRNGFAPFRTFLRVAISGARLHRAGGTHPAGGLKRAALVKNGLSGRFFVALERAADHHARFARRRR